MKSKITIYYLLLLAIVVVTSCKKSGVQEGKNADINLNANAETTEWLKDAIIYEINTRNFSTDGNFAAVEKDLDRIKKLGVKIIWFMPIHPISVKNRKQSPTDLGSAYSVADYKKVNPDYGTIEDFKSLVNKAHELNMKVIIDWVPNHTGWDNPWITEHPEFYTKDSLGNIIDPIDYNTGKSWGWTDVADLDYENDDMRDAMMESLRFWVKETNLDGFRFDVAHGVPVDFWDRCSSELRSLKNDIFLLAEAEGDREGDVTNFDMTYAWGLHHKLNDIAKYKADADTIHNFLLKSNKVFGKKHIKMMFTTNHDENTWNGTVFERMGKLHEVMAVLCWTLDGMPLIYNGQEAALNKRIEFFVQDPIDWGTYELQNFYEKLGKLKQTNPSLYNSSISGTYTRVELEDKRAYAYKRTKDNNEVLVILNFDNFEKTLPINTEGYIEFMTSGATIEAENIKISPNGYWVGTKN